MSTIASFSIVSSRPSFPSSSGSVENPNSPVYYNCIVADVYSASIQMMLSILGCVKNVADFDVLLVICVATKGNGVPLETVATMDMGVYALSGGLSRALQQSSSSRVAHPQHQRRQRRRAWRVCRWGASLLDEEGKKEKGSGSGV